jgi:adenine-specific DNA-methyltransferase
MANLPSGKHGSTEIPATPRQLPRPRSLPPKPHQKLGLVFEEHVPEMTLLPGFPPEVGSLVQLRDDLEAKALWRVTALTPQAKRATITSVGGGEVSSAGVRDLVVVKRFGEPMYPVLSSVGRVRRAELHRPSHAVINGENLHALQLLLYQFERQVDCIYIDPPYNTGARDWKYNNRYVDQNDVWRHSKWLSMMEKRLRLAKRLLKPDGVLICTIDEYEVHHLGMLLEKLYPEYLQYMVTVVINPKGRDKLNFAPVSEYAFFMVPDTGNDLIARAPGRTPPAPAESSADGDDGAQGDVDGEVASDANATEEDDDDEWEYRHARRRGGGAEQSSYRSARPNQFYPIYIDEDARKVVRAGKSIPLGEEPSVKKVKGLRPIWPIDREGGHRCWAFVTESMQQRIDAGDVLLGKYHAERDDWTINYRVPKKTTRKLKNVWWETAHDAGTHGTELLRKLLGKQGLFPFPKSVYAVRDALAAVVRDRPNALIVDFFAGSGTTFHATCLLNAEDGGERRTILVTNNEVAEKAARQLATEGHHRGDPDFEKHGIFEQVTMPRCTAVLTGKTPGGTPVPGRHVDARGQARGPAFQDGFRENIEFFRLDYVDPDDVDLRRAFDAILPVLWLAAGGVGERGVLSPKVDYAIPDGSSYGVLFNTNRFRKFQDALKKRSDVTHVWIVTDSEDAFIEMRMRLPASLRVSLLPRDYLRHFRINTERTA